MTSRRQRVSAEAQTRPDHLPLSGSGQPDSVYLPAFGAQEPSDIWRKPILVLEAH